MLIARQDCWRALAQWMEKAVTGRTGAESPVEDTRGYLVNVGFLGKARGRKGEMQRKNSLHMCQIISLLEEDGFR